jgi:hypothetical protein
MIWAEHETRIGDRRCVYRVLVGKSGGRDHLEDPSVVGRIILKWIFSKWDMGVWTGLSWLRMERDGGHCECGNEHWSSIKCGYFLD